jgi:hypothetical protein
LRFDTTPGRGTRVNLLWSSPDAPAPLPEVDQGRQLT